MSARQHSEAEFQSLLRRLDIALEASNIGVWEHSLDQNVLTWDARMHKLYCTTPTTSALPVEIWMGAIHPDDAAAAMRDFADAIAHRGNYHSEFRIVWPNGAVRHIRSMANYYINSSGEPAFIGVEWDVTSDVELNRALAFQQQIAEERAAALQASRAQIEYAAEHDYLTGLPNRRSFDRHCQLLLADDSVRRLAVMHIDLDRFKQVNDERGHEAGDLVLRKAAEAITGDLRQGDIAARMGGDEFVLVAVNPSGSAELEQRALKIIDRLAAGVEFRGEHFAIGASIGIATGEGREVEPLLKDADMALYSAKRQGRGHARFYRQEDEGQAPTEGLRAQDLALALERSEIRPHYRLQFDARTEELVALEVVPVWSQPILLDAFEPLAGATDLLEHFYCELARAVVEDIVDWKARGLAVPGISFAIQPELLACVRLIEILSDPALKSVDFCVELSGAGLHRMSEPALDGLKSLRRCGIAIQMSALADQQASLVAFLTVRPDRLKMERALVSPLTSQQAQLHLIHSFAELARAFDLTVVVSGVESAQDAERLRHLGFERLLLHNPGAPLPKSRISLDSPRLKLDLKG